MTKASHVELTWQLVREKQNIQMFWTGFLARASPQIAWAYTQPPWPSYTYRTNSQLQTVDSTDFPDRPSQHQARDPIFVYRRFSVVGQVPGPGNKPFVPRHDQNTRRIPNAYSIYVTRHRHQRPPRARGEPPALSWHSFGPTRDPPPLCHRPKNASDVADFDPVPLTLTPEC